MCKKLEIFGWESSIHLSAFQVLLFFVIFFSPFSFFSPFLTFKQQWLTFYGASVQLKNFWESILATGNFYQGVAKCSHRKFCFDFFTQISEHFCAYISFQWVNLSDLGIIGYHFLLQNLSIDNANFGQRWWHHNWKKGQHLSWPVMGSMGVNGLSKKQSMCNQKLSRHLKSYPKSSSGDLYHRVAT